MTAARFLDVPGEPGVRYYKTGDIGRFREDGCLIFLGRRDHQIKINGHRIEIGEIEACLSSHPEVDHCAVKALSDPVRGTKLVAYLQKTQGRSLDEAALRCWLEGLLPYYKIPRQWVLLESFPQLSSGKLDRNALPEPPEEHNSKTDPATPTEQVIREMWVREFGLETIGCEDNFFGLGGDSLQMINLTNALQERFGKAVPQNLLFRHPTIRSLAACLDKNLVQGGNLIPLSKRGLGRPLFIVHGWAGTVYHWMDLVAMIHQDRPVIGIQGNEFCGSTERHASVEELAEDYANQIIKSGVQDPIDLAGYSLGGIYAYAVACKLHEKGREIGRLFIVDTQPRNLPRWVHYRMIAPYLATRLKEHLCNFLKHSEARNLGFVRRRWDAFRNRMHTESPQEAETGLIDYTGDYYHELSKHYIPRPMKTQVSLMVFKQTRADLKLGWAYLSKNPVLTYQIEGEHMDLLEAQHMDSFAWVFARALEAQSQD